MSLANTPEFKLSMAMQPACDRVLCDVFNIKPDKIERFDKDSKLFILDQKFHIDMVIHLNNGSQLTGQEKTLSNHFYKFRTFTIEFWQNRNTQEKGEFFHIASQFYLHGYADAKQENFVEWKIINILDFIDWLKNVPVDKLSAQTRAAAGSRAAFLPIPYDKIPEQFIYASSDMKGAA